MDWFAWGGMIGDLNADGGDKWGEYANLGLAMTGFGDFIFQAMFAATGATIVSGAVAERKVEFIHDFRRSLRWCCLPYSRFLALGWWSSRRYGISKTLPVQPLFTHLEVLGHSPALWFLVQEKVSTLKMA